ncbi:serine/threonine protein phosphatase [Halobellus sp. Atlit-31R]|nr:serine/threonine protein phosphatase [Halobellus sp. Atlit-31R]
MRGGAFAPGLEAQHRRLDADDYDNIYVVGDVHGCRTTAERLLQRLDPAPTELVVFVGDLVRRGPDSPGVVDLVRSRPNLLSIRGNNEEKIIEGRRPPEGLDADDVRWLRSLPAIVSWDDTVVLHGGVDPARPRQEHTQSDIQNTESLAPDGDGRPFWWERYDGPERIYFGHKVLSRPYVGDHAVGLDTGCVYGGALTAYDCTNDRTISVDADRAYKQRAARKFLDPYESTAV